MRERFEEYNSNPSRILEEIATYLNQRQPECYKSVPGLCNPIVDKNPFASNFLRYYLENRPRRMSLKLFVKNTLRYAVGSVKSLAYHGLLILFSDKSPRLQSDASLLVVDFFNFDKKSDCIFGNLYFPGLQDDLKAKGLSYIYLPKLYHFPRNIRLALSELKDIEQKNPSFVSPYSIIPRWQILTLIWYTISQYWNLVKTLRPFSRNQNDEIYNAALTEVLGSSDTNKHLCYLAGKNLVNKVEINKVILWHENQIIDKCFIAGLRHQKDISIIGCQFFLRIPQEQNLFPSDYEIARQLFPDQLLSLQDVSSNTRYLYLNQKDIKQTSTLNDQTRYTALLTLYEPMNRMIVNFLSKSEMTNKPVGFKRHPGNQQTQLPLGNLWKEVIGHPETVLLNSDILFATDSGILFEAMALGKQVVIIGEAHSPTHYLPPKKYEGKLWIRMEEPTGLMSKIQTMLEFKKSNPDQFLQLTSEFRQSFFETKNQRLLDLI